MAKLSASKRNALPQKVFAGPNRSYPIPDRSHGIAAKSMATRYASPSVKAEVDAKVAKKFPGLGDAMKRMK